MFLSLLIVAALEHRPSRLREPTGDAQRRGDRDVLTELSARPTWRLILRHLASHCELWLHGRPWGGTKGPFKHLERDL